ncbi:hypothetical protein [Hyalangium rubrum]|uniref:Uncharacterized protein n=1 Tax=Hyalangium rubrum TaxID=3103134 RepID=A0ABU5HDI6_9BACT|nr:hypothetical protein [Hyalangium sp. s54d21]MDY7231159.1 hypothetical protein [Hyalangium sp. s54d21]
MSDAPTPAPHTPANYLEGGGSTFFSRHCQQLLINAKLNPDWFGSYSHVDRLCGNAREKCQRWDSATQPERDSGTASDGSPLHRPTPGDRYLASCQSGHMVRDSNFRETGRSTDGLNRSARGDPCRNLVDGYISHEAPAVPQQGRAANPRHEHGRHTGLENSNTADRRQHNYENGRPEEHYRQRDRHADEDSRTSSYVSDHQKKWRGAEREARNQPPGAGASSGAGAGGSAASAGGPGGAAGSGLGNVSSPTCAPGEVVDGNTAAKCINNWRKKAEEQMKRDVADATDDNAAAATPPANFPGRHAPPPSHQAQYQSHLDQRVLTARAAYNAAKGTSGASAAKGALMRASANANEFRNAGCLAEQGARLRGDPGAGPPRTRGRAR